MKHTDKYIQDHWNMFTEGEKRTFVDRLKNAYETMINIVDERKKEKD